MQGIIDWQLNGGQKTLSDFSRLSVKERLNLIDYMESFSLYEAIDVGSSTFILVHAGLENSSLTKKLSEYILNELVWTRPNTEVCYFNDPSIYIVSGHTPTLAITGKAEIDQSHQNICIDCGAAFNAGKLAYLCLNTMEAFYVK